MRTVNNRAISYMGPLLVLGASWQISAFGALQVVPTRVVLTDEAKVTHITIRHTGNRPGHYKISPIFYRMNASGGIEPVTDATSEERPLMKFIRFSPRQVTLPPNMEQVIKVMYAGPNSLADGEYRTHLHFEPAEDDETVPFGETKKGKISMKLQARIAVAIPVFFRHGKTSFNSKLSDLTLVNIPADKSKSFSAVFESSGNGFPFGDFYAWFTPSSGEAQQIGVVRGISSYVSKRTVSYPLSVPSNLQLKNGTLKLEFREPSEGGSGDGKVITSVEATLP